ncbi:hypothetical protein EYV94_07440 [Puteibacter caeruleilacunae]|nr:hypothetical protein EYV94_07440 [Puteibacter caeruleilacunae]
MIKNIILLLLFSVICKIGFSQEIPQDLKGESFKKAKIVLNDYTKIETGKIWFEDNSVYYFDVYGTQKILAAKNINYIRYAHGNQKFLGLKIGAIAGTLSGLVSTVNYRDYYGEPASLETIISWTTGALVIGSAIGFGIGSLIPKWKTTIIKDEDYETHLDIRFTPLALNGVGCSLTYNF